MSKRKTSSSKWTPDISIDGNKGLDRDDELIKDLGKKLGVEGDDIPAEFEADGLDYLLNVPKYGVPKNKEKKSMKKNKKEEEEEEAPVLVAPAPVKKQKKEKAKTKEIPAKEEEEEEKEQVEEEDIQDPEAVIAALKKQKEEKKKASKPATEIDHIFSALGEKKKTKSKKVEFLSSSSYVSVNPVSPGGAKDKS